MRPLLGFVVLVLVGCGGKQEALLSDLMDAGAEPPRSEPRPGHPNPHPPPTVDAGSAIGTLTCPFEAVGDAGTTITYDRSCGLASDCAIGSHELDCCGSLREIGINKSEVDRFVTDTGICHSGGPRCDCLAAPIKAEDGRSAPSEKQIVVDCVVGVCRTRVML